MRHLLSGLDTVECAYYLRPGPECKLDFEALRAQRESLRQSRQPEEGVIEVGGTEFLMSPNGTRSGYPFLISNQHCAIQFGEFNDPGFFVTYRSLALWTRGAERMHQQFLEWADSLGLVAVRPEGLSRCDFAFDFHLPEIDFDEDNFVTTADKDSQHRKNGRVQTFTFGRGDVVLRVYNKSDEVEEASAKYWLRLFWQGETENIWRVEWQVRKELLKRFGLRTFQDLFDGNGDLLRYLVSEQTSLRVKAEDSNRSRWPVHPLWKLLSEQIDQLPGRARRLQRGGPSCDARRDAYPHGDQHGGLPQESRCDRVPEGRAPDAVAGASHRPSDSAAGAGAQRPDLARRCSTADRSTETGAMSMLPLLLEAVNARKNRALRIAEAALPESQFRAFRGLFLDEFGRNGLERELERIVAEQECRHGKDTGRPTHAGKEVPHA